MHKEVKDTLEEKEELFRRNTPKFYEKLEGKLASGLGQANSEGGIDVGVGMIQSVKTEIQRIASERDTDKQSLLLRLGNDEALAAENRKQELEDTWSVRLDAFNDQILPRIRGKAGEEKSEV